MFPRQEPGKGAGPRNRVIDHKPEGVDNDPDYQKFQREASPLACCLPACLLHVMEEGT